MDAAIAMMQATDHRVGTLADKLVFGEGDTADVVLTTAGDVAFILTLGGAAFLTRAVRTGSTAAMAVGHTMTAGGIGFTGGLLGANIAIAATSAADGDVLRTATATVQIVFLLVALRSGVKAVNLKFKKNPNGQGDAPTRRTPTEPNPLEVWENEGGAPAGGAHAPRPIAPAAGCPLVNGKAVPELKLGTDTEMAREALGHFKTTTQGWTAADKAAYWEALAAQIEARHAPAWVSAALRGPNGEYIFSGGNLNVHGMVITSEGKVLRIPQDCTITPDFTKPGAATVNYKNP